MRTCRRSGPVCAGVLLAVSMQVSVPAAAQDINNLTGGPDGSVPGITTASLVMTGWLSAPVTMETAGLVMTGWLGAPVTMETAGLVMTGWLGKPITLTTPKLGMTGWKSSVLQETAAGLAQPPGKPEPQPLPPGPEPRPESQRGARPPDVLQTAVPLPDLQIRTANVDPSNPKVVKVHVANTGKAPSAATRVSVRVPQGKAWYGRVPSLGAGQDTWTTVQAETPLTTYRKVFARVDDPDQVEESDEGNNGHEIK